MQDHDQAMEVLVVGSSRLMSEALARLVTDPDRSITARGIAWPSTLDDDASQPQVVVLEVADLGTVAATAGAIRARWPSTRIVMVVRDDCPISRRMATLIGADSCVSSRLGPEELAGALASQAQGRRREAGRRSRAERPRSEFHKALMRLTPREREVLELLMAGVAADAMATKLGVSSNTVRSHLQAVLSKLGVHSRLEAAAVAHRAGFSGERSRLPAKGSTLLPAPRGGIR